jgi:hypothetical protein
MTIDEAIAALQKARNEVGGEALLLMVDGLMVLRLIPQMENSHSEGPCVYVSDYDEDGMERYPGEDQDHDNDADELPHPEEVKSNLDALMAQLGLDDNGNEVPNP